jgi:hypothetical protein
MDTKRFILYIVGIVVLGPLVAGPIAARWLPHQTPAPVGTVNGPNVSVSNSMGGGVNVDVNTILCAGKISLAQGAATVNDSCFTGDTNLVVCSDVSSVNAVRCEPGRGSLTVEGHGNDLIVYVRVK